MKTQKTIVNEINAIFHHDSDNLPAFLQDGQAKITSEVEVRHLWMEKECPELGEWWSPVFEYYEHIEAEELTKYLEANGLYIEFENAGVAVVAQA